MRLSAASRLQYIVNETGEIDMAEYAFGVDVGGTTVKIGLFTAAGKFLEHWEIPTRKEEGGKYILSDIARSLKDKMQEKGIQTEDVKGIGIGVPGPVLEGGVVTLCVNLGWGVTHVAEDLSKLMDGLKVEVGNDANVAGLGEAWVGGGKGFKSIVMVTLGTGVGGAYIKNGKILHGAHGAGAEIGHMTIHPEEPDACACGRHGCLEQYASANGITRVARRALSVNTKKTVLKNDETLSAKTIFDAAKAGDEVALKLVDDFGATLGHALAAIAIVVDPDAFIIGGGVCKAGSIVTDTIEKHYLERVFPACRQTEFKVAKLGNDAGIYGAVKMVIG